MTRNTRRPGRDSQWLDMYVDHLVLEGRSGSSLCFLKALGSWSKSVDAWKEALSCLPTESEGDSLTETDKRLQLQFTEGLAKAEQALAGPEEPIGTTFMKTDEMPWQRAEAVVDQFAAEQKVSSVKPYSPHTLTYMLKLMSNRLLSFSMRIRQG